MTDQPKRCPTLLIDDTPAEEDAFASDGDIGPHQRVADALFDVIDNESGGKMIGLEGGWGSGKSTVVTLLSKHLEKNEKNLVVVFDAWAHEGDPLRRTYLESLIKQLGTKGWIALSTDLEKKTEWDNKKEELAKRLKHEATQTTPKVTNLGKAYALSALGIPLGAAFVSAAFAGGFVKHSETTAYYYYIFGIILAVLPLVVILLNAIRVTWKKWHKTAGDNEWAFLFNESTTKTTTKTTETTNPTSCGIPPLSDRVGTSDTSSEGDFRWTYRTPRRQPRNAAATAKILSKMP